jgi:hypothetical protein
MAQAQALAMNGAHQRKQQAAMQAAMQGGKFDPVAYQQAGGDLDLADLKTLNEMNRRHYQYIEGPDGVYQIDPDTGESRLVQQYEKQAPSGYEYVDGKLQPIPGGPADLGTIKGQAQTRRGVTVSMPTPSRKAPKKGGGSGGTDLAHMSDAQLFQLLGR